MYAQDGMEVAYTRIEYRFINIGTTIIAINEGLTHVFRLGDVCGSPWSSQ